MKLRVGDRIVSAVLGLLTALLGVGVILYLLLIQPQGGLSLTAPTGWQRWVVIGVCALLILLGLRGISVLFRRRDRGFVLQRMEYGDMSISMKALENMIRRCVEGHEAMKLGSIRISRVREGISVDLRVTLMGGTNIPLTVNALQKQIKQYITSCSGIDVREVRVQVETDLARLAPPQVSSVEELPGPQEPARLSAKHLWRHKEEPDTYGVPPAVQEAPTEQPAAPEVMPEENVQPEENGKPEELVAESAQTEEPAKAEEPASSEEPAQEEAAAPEENTNEEPVPLETETAAETIVGEEQA